MFINMNRKIMNLWLMAALVCGLSMSVTSCKDDDDNPGGEPETEEQAATVSKFWSVVGQLVSSDDYTVDYEDKTFEPVYGIADAANETTRIVETNDMRTAASCFADLVGAAIDENTPSYTYSDPEVGTLTYTRGGTAEDWATVDVSIKQLPRLRKIIYRVGGEGTNASFREKAWYRFGDVVSRQNQDGQTEYWICVRPAFGPEKKSDSHWVCLNTVPQKNLFHVNGSNGTQYYVPTGVGTNTKRMQDLAEMFYAMVYPEKWYETATNNHTDGLISFSGVPIFTDFTKANLMYHNQHFWKRVAAAWEKRDIADKALNTNFGTFVDRIEHEGITLLYEGYSWWSKTSWNCKLYQASYTNGTSYDEKNLHHAVYTKPEKNMKSIKFDCRTMGDEMSNYQDFFGDTKLRWVIRHATGKELNGGSQPAPTSRLQGGCKDEYRYYDEYPDQAEKSGPKGNDDIGPEVADPFSNEPQDIPAKVGALVGLDGKFYENKAKCEAAGTQPVAMVVYLSTDGHRVEKGKPWTGLALALSDVTEGNTRRFKWLDVEDYKVLGDKCSSVGGYDRPTELLFSGLLDGWAMTQHLANHQCFASHRHTCAEKAWSTENRPAGFSEWFLPSSGQWALALKSMGYTFTYNDVKKTWRFSGGSDKLWRDAGVPDAKLRSGDVGGSRYASTTEFTNARMTMVLLNPYEFDSSQKHSASLYVRRMIAFGDGGTIDPEAMPQPIQPRPGAAISSYGRCYATLADLQKFEDDEHLVGMVVYYSPTKRVEKGKTYNGLAIMLKDLSVDDETKLAWCSDDKKLTVACGTPVSGAADYANALNGNALRGTLLKDNDGHTHPAFSETGDNLTSWGDYFGDTFIPSAGQWILAKQGMGYTWSTDGMGHFNTAGKWLWPEAGLAQYATADVAEYWTCTEQKDGNTYKVLAVSPNGVSFKLHDKTDKLLVRPFFAFGHWGTED